MVTEFMQRVSAKKMLVSTAILGIIAIYLFIYGFKTIRQSTFEYICMMKLPGPPINDALTGNLLPLWTSPENMFKTLREFGRTYFPIYKMTILHLTAANILSPDDCELILTNPKHMEKSFIYTLLHDWLGTGLLTSSGLKWQIRRKILTPAFHFSILQQFIAVFNEETEKLVQVFKDECHKSYININSHITQFTLKTITETAMGTKLQFNTRKDVAYKQAIFDIGELLLYRLVHSWFLYNVINWFNPRYYTERRVTRRLHRFTRSVIAERQKNFNEEELADQSKNKRLAMLDLLLTAKNKDRVIDDEGIREEVDTFMFEGHDTTGVALGFALMLLACHKHIQEQIVQEMKDVLGDLHKKPTYNDLQEMKLMEMALKETLRMYPSVHFISRKLGEDTKTRSGYYLPKGSIVNLHIYDLHHNPGIYPDPEKFDPDRFLPENIKTRHPFAYLPFSAGLRNCIGKRFAMLELKTALCGILANFILEPVDTPATIVLVVDLVLRTKNGIRVKFVPRSIN